MQTLPFAILALLMQRAWAASVPNATSSGYIELEPGTGSKMFYSYHEAQEGDAKQAPVVVWLQVPAILVLFFIPGLRHKRCLRRAGKCRADQAAPATLASAPLTLWWT